MRKIKIDDLTLEKDNNFFILADTAFSHEGDIDYLKNQIDNAYKAKVNGIKFQILLDYKDAYTKNSNKIRNWCIDQEEDWIEAFELAKAKGLEIVVLPIDMKSLKFCKDNINYINALEIHSISLNEVPFLREIKTISTNIILGVGGRKSKDIFFTLKELNQNNSISNKNTILMFGFQSFPTKINNINLSKFRSLKNQFKLILGYADHTYYKDYKTGNDIIKYSFLYGARIFEKHLVLEIGEKRVDYEAAISHKEFIELRENLEHFIKILGNDDLNILNEAEKRYRDREKQLIVKRDLKKGDILNVSNIGYKVSTEKSDFEQKDYDQLIKKELK
ncbi:MAG: N-acetylneuraminate synthase family protein, partial [Promethearchaeota archaeon]